MSSDGIQFYYGGYTHDKGEVYPKRIEIIPRTSERGVRWATLMRMHVAGSFVNTNPELDEDGVDTKILAIRNAYLNDYQNCGFILSDGTTLSSHQMLNNDAFSLSGNKIKHRSWDNEFPTEMANTRSFSVVIENLFASFYNEILHFSESTTRVGDGGERWRLYNLWDANETPVRETIFNKTKVTHITRGTIVGMTGWPTPPSPLWPLEEQTWLRKITQVSPAFHGDLSFFRGTHYAVHYEYHFERSGPDATTKSNTWFNG